jgi:hypothetical protein
MEAHLPEVQAKGDPEPGHMRDALYSAPQMKVAVACVSVCFGIVWFSGAIFMLVYEHTRLGEVGRVCVTGCFYVQEEVRRP